MLSSVTLKEENPSVDVPPGISSMLRYELDKYLYMYQAFLSWPRLKIRYSIVQFGPGRLSNDASGPPGGRDGFLVVDARFESAGKEVSSLLAAGSAAPPQSIHSAVRECAWKIALHASGGPPAKGGDDAGEKPEPKRKSGTDRTKGWWVPEKGY
jgi:hypothetical protein